MAVNWPVQLNGVIPLNLVARGRLVCSDATLAAMSIESYDFKTRGSKG